MAVQNYTPLISEVLTKVNNAKVKEKKIKVLQEHDSQALRMIIKSSFDPKIEWIVPKGEVPYIKNEAPEGTEHTLLSKEAKKLYRFIKGGDDKTPIFKRDQMFIQMLEGLSKEEAELLIWAKDNELNKHYKGLTSNLVKEAFDWNDDFMRKNS